MFDHGSFGYVSELTAVVAEISSLCEIFGAWLLYKDFPDVVDKSVFVLQEVVEDALPLAAAQVLTGSWCDHQSQVVGHNKEQDRDK